MSAASLSSFVFALNIIIAVVVVVWLLATEVMFHELALTLQLSLNGVMGVG